MKQVFKKIAALLMAFVVLFSTMSFTISEHFCGDSLVASALFSKAESCGMEMESIIVNSDCNSVKKDCCSNEIKQIEGQSNLKIDFNNLTNAQQEFVAVFTYSYLNLFDGIRNKPLLLSNYIPPLVHQDMTVLYGVFRI